MSTKVCNSAVAKQVYRFLDENFQEMCNELYHKIFETFIFGKIHSLTTSLLLPVDKEIPSELVGRFVKNWMKRIDDFPFSQFYNSQLSLYYLPANDGSHTVELKWDTAQIAAKTRFNFISNCNPDLLLAKWDRKLAQNFLRKKAELGLLI